MATEIDAEAPHNNFDVRNFPLPGPRSLRSTPAPRNPPTTASQVPGASALTYFVTDHLGVRFWQPD